MAAVVMTFVVTPMALLAGTVGRIVLGMVIFVFLVFGAKARLRRLNAEEFWRSRPDD